MPYNSLITTGDFIISGGDFIIVGADYVIAAADYKIAGADYTINAGDYIISSSDYRIIGQERNYTSKKRKVLVVIYAYCPPIISSSSLVMACWRVLLYCRVSSWIRSLALSLAVCIAIMRAACSEVVVSSNVV